MGYFAYKSSCRYNQLIYQQMGLLNLPLFLHIIENNGFGFSEIAFVTVIFEFGKVNKDWTFKYNLLLAFKILYQK